MTKVYRETRINKKLFNLQQYLLNTIRCAEAKLRKR